MPDPDSDPDRDPVEALLARFVPVPPPPVEQPDADADTDNAAMERLLHRFHPVAPASSRPRPDPVPAVPDPRCTPPPPVRHAWASTWAGEGALVAAGLVLAIAIGVQRRPPPSVAAIALVRLPPSVAGSLPPGVPSLAVVSLRTLPHPTSGLGMTMPMSPAPEVQP